MQNQRTYSHSVQLSNIQSVAHLQSDSETDNGKCITLPKVKCAFHPQQSITNFCTCESCLLPLCPSCIKIHTIEHVNMKKINPQYEPITDLLQQIYGEVQELLNTSNQQYKKILQIDSRVGSFRSTIQQKISSVKQSILNEVQKYFAKLDEDVQTKIQNMNYIKMLREYKDQMKRSIIGLKNIEKCFNPSNDKIMRIVIKYKGGDIKKQVQQFEAGINQFLGQVNNNFVIFSVRQDYRQTVHAYLDSIKKIEVSDVRLSDPIPNLCTKLTQVYEKNSQENKKQIRKSIGNFLASSAAKWQNQQNQQRESYNSVASSANKSMAQSNSLGTPLKEEHNKRSLSKGKGLTLIQINNTLNTSTMGHNKVPRAVNICSPMEFNRTTFVRRDR